jgi:galactonate dehydratase
LFVEDPLQIDSIVSQTEVARRVTTPIANGERMRTIWEFRELLANGGSRYVRPDVGLAGGLTHTRKIAAKWSGFQGVLQRHGGYLQPPEAPRLGIRLVDTTVDVPLGPLGDRPLHDIPLRSDGSVVYAV